MKKIGIIGGLSPESTVHYYQHINNQINNILGELHFGEIIINSVNFQNIKQMMDNNEWDKIAIELSIIAKKLEETGADFVVIATNTIHKVADYIQSQIKIPLIHIADCVAKKCIESDISTVGLLGTKYTMTENFISKKLEENGLNVFIPNHEQITKIDEIIFNELCLGIINESSKKYYISVIKEMIKQYNIQGIILGCTEIEMLIKPGDLDIPLFDTMQSHVDEIVDYSLSEKQIQKIIKL